MTDFPELVAFNSTQIEQNDEYGTEVAGKHEFMTRDLMVCVCVQAAHSMLGRWGACMGI